jgi:hypothetical protein
VQHPTVYHEVAETVVGDLVEARSIDEFLFIDVKCGPFT